MQRFSVLPTIVLVAMLSACASRPTVRVPPRVDLRQHELIGVIDFSQILVPVGKTSWLTLIRKHYPMSDDQSGVLASEVLDLDGGTAFPGFIEGHAHFVGLGHSRQILDLTLRL